MFLENGLLIIIYRNSLILGPILIPFHAFPAEKEMAKTTHGSRRRKPFSKSRLHLDSHRGLLEYSRPFKSSRTLTLPSFLTRHLKRHRHTSPASPASPASAQYLQEWDSLVVRRPPTTSTITTTTSSNKTTTIQGCPHIRRSRNNVVDKLGRPPENS